MIGTTAVVVDSAAYLPAAVATRYGVITVPLTVVVDGQEFREFEDLDAATFYDRLAAGATVATSQPPPGQFVEAYARAADAGAERIISIHTGAAISGTVNSARIAAEMASLPVQVVDSGQVSFIEGLCAWELCEALAEGLAPEAAEARAHAAGAAAGNIFIVRGLDLLRAGGRYRETETATGVPVLALVGDRVQPVGSVSTTTDALDAIAGHVEAAIAASPGKAFRVGVSNGAADALARQLHDRLAALPAIDDLVIYEIGPAVGAHTGPGCVGAVYLPRPLDMQV